MDRRVARNQAGLWSLEHPKGFTRIEKVIAKKWGVDCDKQYWNDGKEKKTFYTTFFHGRKYDKEDWQAIDAKAVGDLRRELEDEEAKQRKKYAGGLFPKEIEGRELEAKYKAKPGMRLDFPKLEKKQGIGTGKIIKLLDALDDGELKPKPKWKTPEVRLSEVQQKRVTKRRAGTARFGYFDEQLGFSFRYLNAASIGFISNVARPAIGLQMRPFEAGCHTPPAPAETQYREGSAAVQGKEEVGKGEGLGSRGRREVWAIKEPDARYRIRTWTGLAQRHVGPHEHHRHEVRGVSRLRGNSERQAVDVDERGRVLTGIVCTSVVVLYFFLKSSSLLLEMSPMSLLRVMTDSSQTGVFALAEVFSDSASFKTHHESEVLANLMEVFGELEVPLCRSVSTGVLIWPMPLPSRRASGPRFSLRRVAFKEK